MSNKEYSKIFKLKNVLDRLNIRLDEAKDIINELKDRVIENR